MYERSAIVLERYFENLLGFNQANNLKQNFKNYCDLFEKFELFQEANSEEFNALSEFQAAENSIEEIQKSSEKLYKKNAKLEYNRDLIFSDITQNPDEIEKCIVKIENDISKVQTNLISLREQFVEAVRIYNEKKSRLANCKKNRKNAEKEYDSCFEILNQSIENIEEKYIEIAKNFATEETQEELISVMIENGKDEKIPFNNSVITNAAKLGVDILKSEVECYIEAYKMAKKLIAELLEGAVSMELHKKTIRNINAKLRFFNAEKEYLIQFLDYERITVIYGKRTHRTLMVEACEKFELDVIQINNLYQLLLREIANKSTKKAYKELYNKSYLIDIKEKEAKFKKEKNRMNLPVGTIMNSNYWRIEGIKNIYTVFYKEVSEVFGKDLVEFDIPNDEDGIENADIEIDETKNVGNEKIELVVAKEESKEEKVESVVAEEESKEEKVELVVAEEESKEEKVELVVAEEESKEEKVESVVAEEESKEEKVELAVTEEESKEEKVELVVAEEESSEEKAELVVAKKKNKKEKVESVEPVVTNEEKTINVAEKFKKSNNKNRRYTRKISSSSPENNESNIEEEEKNKHVKEDIVAFEQIDEENIVKFEQPDKEVISELEEADKEDIVEFEEIDKEDIVAFEQIDVEEKNIKDDTEEISLFEKINLEEDDEEDDDYYDIFEDDYVDIEKRIAELDELEYEDESIFENFSDSEEENLNLTKNKKGKNKKSGILNKIMKLNTKEKKKVNS